MKVVNDELHALLHPIFLLIGCRLSSGPFHLLPGRPSTDHCPCLPCRRMYYLHHSLRLLLFLLAWRVLASRSGGVRALCTSLINLALQLLRLRPRLAS